MELMQPKTVDPAQQQSNAILKVLPIMIGWFALSVPAALSVYWVTNNIITTATSLWIRSSMKVSEPKTGGAATMAAPAAQSIFSPPREKPSGFGEISAPVVKDGVKTLTAMDAEIVEEDDGGDDGDDSDESSASSNSESKRKRRKGTKKKTN
jgi:YidC/Oxa1 family membrane protein insertase